MNPTIANMGVPMLFLQGPAMLIALVPVIAVEILIARRMMTISWSHAGKALVVANLTTTLVGFPLIWLLLLGFELLLGGGRAYGLATFPDRLYAVTIQAPWLIPYRDDLPWMIPFAAAYLLIPAFFGSVYVERWICRRLWRDQPKELIRRFSWSAHVASYSALIVVAAIYYWIILRRG